MNRRQLLSLPASLTGYSLYVNAAQLSPASAPAGFSKPDFQKIAPAGNLLYAPNEPHMVQVNLNTELFVAGGGLAGVCAAIAAARRGVKVVLVQDRSRLGGNSSSEVKMHVVGADCHGSRAGWREGGIIEELRLEDGLRNPQRSWELWDLLLYDKVVSEPNITLLLDTTLYRAETDRGAIRRVWARCDRTEHLYAITAQQYIDATGDSRLGVEAGAEYRIGRETRREFNESLAPEEADKETLGSSILFTSRLYQKPMPFTPPSWARKVTKDHLKFRKTDSWEYGYWWIEWGGNIDTVRDNERIRFECLAIVMGVWDYIKNSGNHTASANWAMDWVGMMPGKRGSRRLVGDTLITQSDLVRGTYPDAVAIGGWPMDDHPPGGFDRSDLPPNTSIRTDEVFEIPLRSLYSKNVSNLFLAGRNISATHVAFTSTRVMATCAAVGQAAGTAAALCIEKRLSPRALANQPALVSQLQQRLLRDDQTLRSIRNADPEDLALTATASSSACQEGCEPSKVLDGISRDIPKSKVQPEVIHSWVCPMNANGESSPWLRLDWAKPVKVSQVQFIFESGLKRQLTLSAQEGQNRRMIRGTAQPETVKDYEVQVLPAGKSEWKTVATVAGNFHRLRRHSFAAETVTAVRIVVKAMNGEDQPARVSEVRAYA